MDHFISGKESSAGAVVHRRDRQDRVGAEALATRVILAVGWNASDVLLAGGRLDIYLNVKVVVHDVTEQSQVEAASDGYRGRTNGRNDDALLKAVKDRSGRVGLLRASWEAEITVGPPCCV